MDFQVSCDTVGLLSTQKSRHRYGCHHYCKTPIADLRFDETKKSNDRNNIMPVNNPSPACRNERHTADKQVTPGLVTLFCDVSFCPNSGAAGYGAWYRTDDMEKGEFFGESIPVACSSSNDAEFWGIAMSLRKVFQLLGDKATTVVVQCDNIAALSWMREFHPNAGAVGVHHGTHGIPQAPKSYPNSMGTAIGVVRAMKPSVRIWLKHVKGHSKSKSPRSWVNKKCDALAREYMAARRGGQVRRA
jgi:ribonuclease HI